LLNITSQCGLGSTKSMNDLLFPPHPQQFLLNEEEMQDNKDPVRRGPSFLSSMNTYDEESPQLVSTVTDDENQQLIPSSSEMIEHQGESTSPEVSSEWWQNPEDIRQGHLLKNHLRPLSNASILKPNMSYEEPNLVGLRMPRSPAERLMLLGGIPGVLKHMQECNVLPNNIIFNTLLNVNIFLY
jgi:hypothetical protein